MAAIPAVRLCKGASSLPSASGELGGLIQVYLQQRDAFNHGPGLDDEAADKETDALQEMLLGMIGVPVRSREEAVRAIDFIFEDSKGCMIDFSHGSGRAYAWLLKSARDYMAEEVWA